MIKAYQDMIRKSFRLTSTTNVKSFWLAALMHFLPTVLLAVAGGFGIHFLSKMRGMSQTVNVLIAVLVGLCLLLQWPMVPMYIRRMRDTGKSWPMLIALTLLFPGIGSIAVACIPSGANAPVTRRERLMSMLKPYLDSGVLTIEAESDYGLVGWLHNAWPILLAYKDVEAKQTYSRATLVTTQGLKDLHLTKALVKDTADRIAEMTESPEEHEHLSDSLRSLLQQLTSSNTKARLMHRGGLAMLAIGIVLPATLMGLLMSFGQTLYLVVFGVGALLFFAGLVISYMGKARDPKPIGDDPV